MLLLEIDQKLLFPRLKASGWEEALDRITEKMIACGYVRTSFQEAVKQREREYPTGLKVKSGIGAAIPHADPEHVLCPVTAVASMMEPVLFKDMEGEETAVSLIFVQAIRNPSEHIDAMGEIIMLLRDADTVEALLQASGPEKMLKAIESFEEKYDALS